MALADTIRDAVAIADTVSKSVQETVTHRVWTGQDAFGAKTFVNVTRRALVEQKLQERKTAHGVVQCKAKLTFLEPVPANGAADRVEPIDPKDRFILADGSSGPIVDVEGMRNPGVGPFLLEVYLGVSV